MSQGAKNPDIRWKQRVQSFRKAYGQLESAVQLSKSRALSELEKQGLIHAFEFTHELAWTTLKDVLESRGETGIYGSKDATRKAFAAGLIEDGDAWMDMIQSRNRSSHTYNEAIADDIARTSSPNISMPSPSLKNGFPNSNARRHEFTIWSQRKIG